MARSVEVILRDAVGNLHMQVAQLIHENEVLKDEVVKYKQIVESRQEIRQPVNPHISEEFKRRIEEAEKQRANSNVPEEVRKRFQERQIQDSGAVVPLSEQGEDTPLKAMEEAERNF